MKGTANINEVLSLLSGKENFISVGEIHNSRSAIKFIMDNFTNLLTKEGGKIYFLTEFLPPRIKLIPDSDRTSFARAIIKHPEKTNIDFDLSKREEDKGDCDLYTLKSLYDFLIKIGIEIHSIEDPYTYGDRELHKKIVADDLPSYELRVNKLNQVAVDKVREIRTRDNSARLIVFAGMGHISNSKIKKYGKDGKSEGEKEMLGITELLRKESLIGTSIHVHDPELCQDKEYMVNFSCTEKGYSKYANNSKSITFDSPDFLLFVNTTEQRNKKIKDAFESIFIPGECDITHINDKNFRVQALTGKKIESVLPNISKAINQDLSEIIKKHLYRITGMDWIISSSCGKWSLVNDNEDIIRKIYNHLSPHLKNAKMSHIMNKKFLITIENTDLASLSSVPGIIPTQNQLLQSEPKP